MQSACRLCGRERILKNSHVISKFVWKASGVTGDKRSFAAVCKTHPELSKTNMQDGFKERLLCEECEGQFGRYEDYSRRVLFTDASPLKLRPKTHFVWSGLDYAKLKLFQMSLLWRMGISGLPYYGNVRLGNHEEVLRDMLRREDPGEPWQYGSIVTLLNHRQAPLHGVFAQPEQTKLFGHRAIRLVLAGMHWYMLVPEHKPSHIIGHLVLQRTGTWVLFRGEISDFPYLRTQVADLKSRNQPKA